MLGTFVLSAGYYDAYFTRAQKVRKLLFDKTQLIFNEFDFIFLPTAPQPPLKSARKWTTQLPCILLIFIQLWQIW